MDRPEGDDGVEDVKPTIYFVIGPDELREKYQIPVNIPLRLPYMSKKCYNEGVEGIGVFEQILKAGLRFPLSHFTISSFST